MRACTRQGDTGLREVFYRTPFGTGRVRLAGDLPVEVLLPDRRRASDGARDSVWSAVLEGYFLGDRVTFPFDVERYVAWRRCTPFVAAVVRALAAVPYGCPVSYRDLARAAGQPRAWRATGSVVAGNDVPIVLPCHRIVRSDGSLGRYGDDPAWKARLLALEGVDLDRWGAMS